MVYYFFVGFSVILLAEFSFFFKFNMHVVCVCCFCLLFCSPIYFIFSTVYIFFLLLPIVLRADCLNLFTSEFCCIQYIESLTSWNGIKLLFLFYAITVYVIWINRIFVICSDMLILCQHFKDEAIWNWALWCVFEIKRGLSVEEAFDNWDFRSFFFA